MLPIFSFLIAFHTHTHTHTHTQTSFEHLWALISVQLPNLSKKTHLHESSCSILTTTNTFLGRPCQELKEFLPLNHLHLYPNKWCLSSLNAVSYPSSNQPQRKCILIFSNRNPTALGITKNAWTNQYTRKDTFNKCKGSPLDMHCLF